MDDRPPNCECVNTGFQHCVLYPKEFCKCSASCTFVNEFFQGGKDDDDAEIISMRTFSGLISPIPDADLEEVRSDVFIIRIEPNLESLLKIIKKSKTITA